MPLHYAMRKHGVDNFACEQIASSWDKENLFELEKLLIAQEGTMRPNGYNATKGGDLIGIGTTDETRQRKRHAHLGVKLSEEHRRAISAGLKGKPKSPEHVAKVKAKQRGRTQTQMERENRRQASLRHNAENPRTAEHGRKISEGHKKRRQRRNAAALALLANIEIIAMW